VEELVEQKMLLLEPEPLVLQSIEHPVVERDELVQLGQADANQPRAEVAFAEQLGTAANEVDRCRAALDEPEPDRERDQKRRLEREDRRARKKIGLEEERGGETKRQVDRDQIEREARAAAQEEPVVMPYFSNRR